MNHNLWGILVSLGLISAILLLSTLLGRKGLIGSEGSRKLIHIGVSNWWLVAMAFFDSPWWAVAVPVLFVAVNLLSHKKGLISAMERGGEQDSLGTVYYPISLAILALLCFGGYSQPYIGGLGVLIMGWGDGLAAMAGIRFGRRRLLGDKTLEGSLCMLAVSFVVAWLLLARFAPENAPWNAALIAVFAAAVEAFSGKGIDNLTVPLLIPAFYQFLLR